MLNLWDIYKSTHQDSADGTRSAAQSYNREFYSRYLPHSLSYKKAVVNGNTQYVAITDSAKPDIKTIYAMPGDTIEHGTLVFWQDTYWLIVEVDMHNEIYMRGTIRRCNYVLRWLDQPYNKSTLIEQQCVIVDGTSILGEDADDLLTIGDARTTLLIGKNKYTQKFRRGSRFLIDDPDNVQHLAYEITKPNRMYSTFDGKGVYQFLLREVNTTSSDNLELGVADYYPPDTVSNLSIPSDKEWL